MSISIIQNWKENIYDSNAINAVDYAEVPNY